MQRKAKRKQEKCEKHRWKEAEKKNGKVTGFVCVNCGLKSKDMEDDPNVIWSMFRCQNLQCNRLLEREKNRQDGYCRGCQGIKFVVATYLTDEETAGIKAGNIKPYRVNLDVVGIEPPELREVG
jgi:hypothetical protein